MESLRHTRLAAPPAVLEYQSRIRGPRVRRAHGPAADPFTMAVRIAGATAGTVVVACLTVAVPCGVSAAVGVWFDDASVPLAARTAAGCGCGAAIAALTAVACHRRLARRGSALIIADWN